MKEKRVFAELVEQQSGRQKSDERDKAWKGEAAAVVSLIFIGVVEHYSGLYYAYSNVTI